MSTLTNTTINDTGYVTLPKGSTAQRPSSPINGMMRYNTDYGKVESYVNGAWQVAGFPYCYYNEGIKANLYTGNWNSATTTTMANFGGLGYATAHGYTTGPLTYTLSLSGLPGHTTLRYCVYWHLVDSLDSETNNLYVLNGSNTETEILRFTKVWNSTPSISILASGTTANYVGNQYYTYTPWGTPSGYNYGYLVVDSGYYAHTLSTFTARHVIGADQPEADEAEYLTHVQVWLG